MKITPIQLKNHEANQQLKIASNQALITANNSSVLDIRPNYINIKPIEFLLG